MQKGNNLTTGSVLLYVNRQPTDIKRTFIEKDAQGNDVREVNFNEQSLRGIWLTDSFGKAVIDMEIPVRPDTVASQYPEAPKFSDILVAFIRNEEAFLSGKKLIEAKVAYQPRSMKSGDKAGVTTSLVPVLVGFNTVDAKPEDLAYVEQLLTMQNKITESDNSTEARIA
ncbi:MAG: hypothetical protein PHY47_00730 [Lachnospiraceae bacterium]|nr:hypothetical protein [Lachnospiraceae bacterium]